MRQAEFERIKRSVDRALDRRQPNTDVMVRADDLAWLLRCQEFLHKRAPVTPTRGPDGQVYVSQLAVAFKLGKSASAISRHLTKYGDLEGYGTNIRRKGLRNGYRKPLSVGGHHWPSINSAAQDMGVAEQTLRRWLRIGDSEKLMAAVVAMQTRLQGRKPRRAVPAPATPTRAPSPRASAPQHQEQAHGHSAT